MLRAHRPTHLLRTSYLSRAAVELSTLLEPRIIVLWRRSEGEDFLPAQNRRKAATKAKKWDETR
jgi:hypothetical protein